MTQAHTFCLTRIQFADRSWQPHWAGLSTRLATTLTSRGANVWGAFSGLFGIASNELLLVTHGPGDDPRPNPALGEARLIEQYLLAPTARPGSPPPALTRPGVYVFRFFDVSTRDIDEIVELSRVAWTTFEDPDRYSAEPLGLFAPADRTAPHGRMLLLTWYDTFGSWEKSRLPAPAARENFQRRHALTHGTVAFATALVAAN
jgi:hypothetical protein